MDKNDPDKKVLVGTLLTKKEKDELMTFLQENMDIFTWSHKDIPRVDLSMVVHRLNIDRKYPSVRQKKRRFSLERNKIVSDEINRLLVTDAIEPCQYPEWLSNVVVVKKEKRQMKGVY